jgi:hypothetical protein
MAAQTSHFKTKLSGASASLSVSPDAFTQISVSVLRGTPSGGSSTSIVFSSAAFAADFQSLTFTQIFGPIADSAFTGDNVNGLHLNLDTSTLDPTVTFSETCTLDLGTFIFTCGPATPGVIQVDFSANGFQSTQILVLEKVVTFGPTTVRTHEKSNTASANAQGSILGQAITVTDATISVQSNSTLEVIRQ